MESLHTCSWKIIDRYFQDNYLALVQHHIKSYNEFFSTSGYSQSSIQQIFNETNPIQIRKEKNGDEYDYEMDLYMGGIDGSRIYYSHPVVNEKENNHYMFPNEARLKNFTYAISIHYDVLIKMKDTDDSEEMVYEKVFLGKIPIMLHSDFCVLKNLPREVRFNMGECKNDKGGYFIIDGKEKCFIPQETFADNLVNISKSYDEKFLYSAAIKTVSEDSSKPKRTMKMHLVASSIQYYNHQIIVEIPNVRVPIPFFILMRALGILSDKEIIEYCLLDIDKNKEYLDLFIPSVHDASVIFDQKSAMEFINIYTKPGTVITDILMNYLLPNIGEDNFKSKALFLGNMAFQLLKTSKCVIQPVDRDNFKCKRVELIGPMMSMLFQEYYKKQFNNIRKSIDAKLKFKKIDLSQSKFTVKNTEKIISEYFDTFLYDRKVWGIVEDGIKKAFKGNWGGSKHTKREGIIQSLNRLSFNSHIAQLRKLNLNLSSSAKVVEPRLLHSSQFGMIDPVDTPDGGDVGTHKHLSIMTHISNNISGSKIKNWIFDTYSKKLTPIELLEPKQLNNKTKIFINGAWVAITDEPCELIVDLKNKRREGKIKGKNGENFIDFPMEIVKSISITFHIKLNIIYIYTDSGRLLRPLYYKINDDVSIFFDKTKDKIMKNKLPWLSDSNKEDSIIEYIDLLDSSEIEDSYICMKPKDFYGKNYSHLEVEPSLMFGILGNQVIFPEHNQLPRNLFSCGQTKQAVSQYNSNFTNRMDGGLNLNYGQIPLIKSRYMKYICNDEHAYGVNTIVAIMSLNGYNVEDAILINEGSVKRGLFHTTYYSLYEGHEESSEVSNKESDNIIQNVFNMDVKNKKVAEWDYSKLDDNGLIQENVPLTDNTVVIGMTNVNDKVVVDKSITPKIGQLGFVDKTFITNGEKGYRIAKVRVRDERIPTIGDKMASRAGQKGMIGLVVPESDMPFTANGIKPDLIINPHAIPSRMTIGQLIEVIYGKCCNEIGVFGECTPFQNIEKSNKNIVEKYGEVLTNLGFHSSGNEVMYDGITGNQLESSIFIGPTYYMRLKHMVKDKIFSRSNMGDRNILTHQTVQGRASGGGLRIGEMERDGVISHGMTSFLKDSFMKRGDEYNIAICNYTGTMAIYDTISDNFYSPLVSGSYDLKQRITEWQNDDKLSEIKTISKYGKSFSIVNIPYCLKLLMHELRAMNIDMRIITEDNIDQLNNIKYNSKQNNFMESINSFVKSKKEVNIPFSSIKLPLEDLEEESEDEDEEEIINEVEEEINIDAPYKDINEMYNEIKYNFGEVLPFYPFVDYSNIIPNLEKEIIQPTTPETPPPAIIYEPTTPDTPPPPDVFQPTTPDTPPPPDDGYVENIDAQKLQKLKQEVNTNNDKSILIQNEEEKNKNVETNNEEGEIKGINIE